MFIDHIKHAFIGAIGTIKNFSLPVKNEFLKIKRHCFGNAEIFGILGNTDLHFLAGAKEMINGIPAGKNYPGISWVSQSFVCGIPWPGIAFQPNKRMKIKLYIIFSRKFKVW